MNIARDGALKILYGMKRIRAVEEEIANRYTEWEMRCPTHLSIGQEAVASVLGYLLNKDDLAVSTHRAHAHYLGKGGNLNAMISEIYGKEAGCSKGRGGSMHLIDTSVGFMGSTAIVGGTIPIGTGIALGIKYRKKKQISCIFLGDGAIEEGAFYESANFAALHKLPVLFICENNLYSVYSPLSKRQPIGRKIHELSNAIGIKSDHGDGNDVIQINNILKNAIGEIRSGNGPRFIEFSTYRWREHCGPNYDNEIGYRTQKEFLEWQMKDPINIFQNLLEEKKYLNNKDLINMNQSIESEILLAFNFAKNSNFPDKHSFGDFTYCD
jgi:TPP-dependent pyruvate/acetoin dehydrogenase alpha subunit